MTQQEIVDLCVSSLARKLRVDKARIDPKAKFNRLGLDSAMIVYVMMELEEKLDLALTTDDVYDYPTLEALSGHLAKLRAARNAA
jgi:acyl carrier protein